MQGPPASEASTSSGSKRHSIVALTPPDAFSPLDLNAARITAGEARYVQPDYAVRTQDDHLPHLETKHAGVTAMRRIFIGPSYRGHGTNQFGMQQKPNTNDLPALDLHTSRLPILRRKRANTGASRLSDASSESSKGRSRRNSLSSRGGGHETGWQGTSFEIGGDIRDAARRRDARLRRQREEADRASGIPPPSPGDRHSTTAVSQLMPKSPALSSTTGASFATAQTHFATPLASPTPSSNPYFASSPQPPPPPTGAEGMSTPHSDIPEIHVTDASSDKATSRHLRIRLDLPNLRSILRKRASTAKSILSFRSARSEPVPPPNVHFLDSAPKPDTAGPGSGAAPPAPPQIVLARPDNEIPVGPKAAERLGKVLHGHPIQAAKPPPRFKLAPDEVVRQERMLVRVDWSPRDDLPDVFDEHVAKKYPTVKETWDELAVVWRASGQIELWSEHGLNFAASLLNRKKLEGVIPLDPKATHLSLYSSTDLVFCLTFRPDVRSRVLARTSHTHARDDRSHAATNAESSRRSNSKATKRGYLHLRSTGTNIFLFRARTHTTAKEWLWRLYRILGGRLPPLLEVRIPGLGAKLYFRIPRDHDPDGDELYDRTEEDTGYRLLQAERVIEECVARLSTVPQWKDLVETAKRQGTSFRLAWRRGSILDWITDPPPGEAPPDWAVVGGFAFRQAGQTSVLELRPASHYPTTCRVPAQDGASGSHISSTIRIAEPPGIEGFVIRITPKGRSRRVYLSTRKNLLFRSRPTLAHAPDPPLKVMDVMNNPAAVVLGPFIAGMATLAQPDKKKREKLWNPVARSVLRDHSHQHRKRRDRALQSLSLADIADEAFGNPLALCDDYAANCDGNHMLEYLETMEKKRAFLQVTDSLGYVRISEIQSVEPELETSAANLDGSKENSRKLRRLIVNFDSGRYVKLECPSNDVRDEWVVRLRALATYWRRRERVDAIQYMELSGSTAMVHRLPARGPHKKHAYEDEPDADTMPPLSRDEVLASHHLTHLYNWCLLDGCRAILREGIMHVKQGLRGMYQMRHVVLLPGILLEFQHVTRGIHGQPLPSPYHRRTRLLHLRDCYVYSGTLAGHLNAPTASTGEWDPADETQHQFPRCYPGMDGLRTADERDDCTFVVFKIKHSESGNDCKLGKKGKSTDARVFRTRSKLERDLFVYALNLSIERLLRGEQEREDRLRKFSWLSKMK